MLQSNKSIVSVLPGRRQFAVSPGAKSLMKLRREPQSLITRHPSTFINVSSQSAEVSLEGPRYCLSDSLSHQIRLSPDVGASGGVFSIKGLFLVGRWHFLGKGAQLLSLG